MLMQHPFRSAPRIARRRFPCGQPIQLIRTQLGLLKRYHSEARRAKRRAESHMASIWPANQAHQSALGSAEEIPLTIAPRIGRAVPYGPLIKLSRMQWGPLNETPFTKAPRIARRRFPYGQLIRFIRMH